MHAVDVLRRDVAQLTELTRVEAVVRDDDGRLYVQILEVGLPAGIYTVSATDALFITDLQYPMSALDMFWVDPKVLLADGRVPQSAESIESHLGRPWRRFSWHRNGTVGGPARNPVIDHFEFMHARFAEDAL